MPPVETAAVWAAAAAYAVASVAFIIGTAFRRPALISFGYASVVAGVAANALAVGARWLRVGHGPAVGFFEVASGLVLVAMAAYVIVGALRPDVRDAGVLLAPFALLALGATALADPSVRELSGTLSSGWLVVHVVFANLAFGAYAGAFAISVPALLARGEEATGPTSARRDALAAAWARAGFALQGVMIATGSIWANEAWGRYWGWDPIEIWSLLAWLLMALYLHATRTLGWRGSRAAWLITVAFAAVTFSLLGVPAAYDSVHGAYLSLS